MFSQERRIIALVIALGILLSSISVSTSSVSPPILSRNTYQLSSEVWSDDFENVTKTLSEWTINGLYYPPNVTLSDGLLYVNGTWENILSHNSTTVIGTWSFDMFHNEQGAGMVVFMSPALFLSDRYQTGYAVYGEDWSSGDRQYSYNLAYWFPDPAGSLIYDIDSFPVDTPSGWSHIDVTRQTDQWMYVFLNGTMILQARDPGYYMSSEYLHLYSLGPVVFDNITVSDTVDLDGVAPHWTDPLINHTINYGEDFSYPLFADDYAGLDTWWMNDTWLFEMSDENVVTSVEPLQVGDYGVEVSVNDTSGNVLSGAFNVEVVPTNTTTPTVPNTGPDPLDPLRISLFGAVGVVWFVAVIFIFCDYRNRRNAS